MNNRVLSFSARTRWSTALFRAKSEHVSVPAICLRHLHESKSEVEGGGSSDIAVSFSKKASTKRFGPRQVTINFKDPEQVVSKPHRFVDYD